MATRQSASKAGARTASKSGARTASQPSQGKPSGRGKAAPARGKAAPARGKAATAQGKAPAAADPPEPSAVGRALAAVATAWQASLRWAGGGLPLATLVTSVLGLGVSVYLTIEHYTQNAYAGCPANAVFNCGKVTTSSYSHPFGIPVAVLGLAFFVFMVAANSPWGWRARQPLVHWARLASVVAGIVFVLYLVYVELFLVDAICLYCTVVHVLTLCLFGLIVTKAALSGVTPASGRR